MWACRDEPSVSSLQLENLSRSFGEVFLICKKNRTHSAEPSGDGNTGSESDRVMKDEMASMEDVLESEAELYIEKKKEGTYWTVPFQMLDHMERLEVSYSYQRWNRKVYENGDECRSEDNIVDIGLFDERGNLRGASGSARQSFFISENEATPGYLKGALHAGKWAVFLGACKIQGDGCKVKIHFGFKMKQKVLLKGDLHLHSVHSDGECEVADLLRMASLQKLDYVFLTDHNTYAQNEEIPQANGLVALPGMEWTHYKGHSNFLGVMAPVRNTLSNDLQTTVQIMSAARKNGAVVVLNHPFSRDLPWAWGPNVPFDAVEIWNGPDADYNAIRWWNERLSEGERIPIVGGSDFHRLGTPRMIGTPTTFLYCSSCGKSDILDAIRKGHAFIGCSPTCPVLHFSIAGGVMGDSVEYTEDMTGSVRSENVANEDRIRLISDQGVELETVVKNKNVKNFSFPVAAHKFYRLEVWRGPVPLHMTLAALSNPIYLRF